MQANYHTHCNFCHGKGQPGEYVEQAISKGFSSLGFSCHGPVPFATDWNMSAETAEKYISAIDGIKEKYKGTLQIYNGMELDYLSGDTRNIFKKYHLDYIIGSVHFIKAGEEYLGVDYSLEEFEKALRDYADSNIEKFAVRYYETVLDMLQKERFDILGHLDLIKKNNLGQRFFKENEQWYVRLVKNAVERISKYKVLVEVNTGGISRGYTEETYPSAWIIRECKRYDIPLVLSADAHTPENIDFYFDEASEIIRSAGYNELWELCDGKWISKRI